MIKAENITKTYQGNKVLNDVSYNALRGNINSITGSNGVGKSTLLRVILGLEIPDKGDLFYDDVRINLKTNKHMQKVGFFLGEDWLIEKFSATEYLNFLQQCLGKTKVEASKNTQYWLSRFDIAHDGKYVSELSHGMKKIVGFISAIINQPDLIILDELFEGMDKENKEIAISILLDLKNNYGTTTILTTHQSDILIDLQSHVFEMSNN